MKIASNSAPSKSLLFRMQGSVMPKSVLMALPCALLSASLKWGIQNGFLDVFKHPDSIVSDTQAWVGFSFLVTFLVVFRTSQAYTRFWDGCTSVHQMRAEWFDACSALVAYCKHSSAPAPAISAFKNTLVRLVSMLHAVALAELEQINVDTDDVSGIRAFGFELIDPDGVDMESLMALKFSTCKVELVFSWIQMLIVENIGTGVLSIPPPILSRSFQEIANGMVKFQDALKITYIPFPFPYAQTCQYVLIVHWCIVPFVVAQWVTSPVWAGVFTMIQVFVLWSLNNIAEEIENPFGADPNDLDGEYMQKEMNRHLLLLLHRDTISVPRLNANACTIEQATLDTCPINSFVQVWADLGIDTAASTARKEDNFTRHVVAERAQEARRSSHPGRLEPAGSGSMSILTRRSRSSVSTAQGHEPELPQLPVMAIARYSLSRTDSGQRPRFVSTGTADLAPGELGGLGDGTDSASVENAHALGHRRHSAAGPCHSGSTPADESVRDRFPVANTHYI